MANLWGELLLFVVLFLSRETLMHKKYGSVVELVGGHNFSYLKCVLTFQPMRFGLKEHWEGE